MFNVILIKSTYSYHTTDTTGLTVTHLVSPVGHILTPFAQKFSIPRQGISLSVAKGEIEFEPHIDVGQSFDGIEAFSHLWLLFIFHDNIAQGYKAKVRPPRLGGNKKIGVFASRSSFRPNGIGMSVVENLGIHNNKLKVGGIDLLNRTPIVDIKPYLPYADVVPNANGAYAQDKPPSVLNVVYSAQAELALFQYQKQYSDLPELIETLLSQDPRPSYKKDKLDEKVYFIQLWYIEIKWVVTQNTVEIIDIYPTTA